MAEDQHSERIQRIEDGLRATQDNVLLIHTDLKQMSKGISDMADSMKILVDIQTNQRIIEERCDSRNAEQKAAIKLVHKRIDEREYELSALEKTMYYLFGVLAAAGISAIIYLNERHVEMNTHSASIERDVTRDRVYIEDNSKAIDRLTELVQGKK